MCEELNLSQNDVELSMGMTDDYEQAVGIQFLKLFKHNYKPSVFYNFCEICAG